MKPAMSPARPLSLRVATERWPIAGAFTISRGSKTQAEVVVAEVDDGLHRGRGECVPYGRYGETVEGVAAAIARLEPEIARGLDRGGLQDVLPAGAAPPAPGCASWGLPAQQAPRPAPGAP